ncbi:MAG: hypothetical protein P1V51_01210 [Deltaproteobacteria bacterium]|nr:hypothetical protein [Deltaproteobacteria bacterium]
MRTGRISLSLALFCLLWGEAALALPGTVSRSDTVDDAIITLTIRDAFILGDARSFCEVRIQVGNSDVAFTSGDTVEVKVMESEGAGGVGDDQLWRTIFNVSAAQVSGGVDQTFDCTTDFLDDTGSTSEIYAEAEVLKDGCGTFCLQDRPSTSAIDVAELDDDGMEENDNFGAAKTLPNGALPSRIARDADWYVIDATGPMSIDVSALHRPGEGPIDFTLHDSFGNPTGDAGVDGADRSRLQVANLSLGTWYLRVLPRTATDFAFYDLESTLTDLTTTCTPGDQSSRDCGRCGTETRSCNGSGEWDPYGTCTGQGVCSPGETVSEACGNCGNTTTRCDDSCTWVTDPTCTDEGPCVPNVTEDQACTGGGSQSRTCQSDCTWTPWGECSAPPLGSACTTDAECGAGLYCATEGGLFPGGYCTQVGCTSDADCAPGRCVQAFGQSWCFSACPMGTECRADYLCVDAPTGKACQPPCRDDLDCWGQTASCGADGLCTGGGGGIPTGDGGTTFGAQGGCGCATQRGLDPANVALFALALGLIFLRPRQARR